jgi:hypothetical protein
VDYSEVQKKRFYKEVIPKGWHQNIINPNTGDNLHEPLDLGTVTHFADFSNKIAKLWNIEYQAEGLLI